MMFNRLAVLNACSAYDIFIFRCICFVDSAVKNQPSTQETKVWSLGQEDPLEETGQPTPVFLPGESHGQRSLVGYPSNQKESYRPDRLTLSLLLCHHHMIWTEHCHWETDGKTVKLQVVPSNIFKCSSPKSEWSHLIIIILDLEIFITFFNLFSWCPKIQSFMLMVIFA